MKKLPIGQDSFDNLMQDDGIYVDKTAYIHQILISGGRTFFLSRPRRFGKSLLLSTIKAIFEGKKDLFKGLYIEDKIDWEPYPVVMLDMSGLEVSSVAEFRKSLITKLQDLAVAADLEIDLDIPASFLARILNQLYERTGKQIVVLLDEYDKPILDAIHDTQRADQIRESLFAFYGTLKAASPILKFLMVTGISKISQMSFFSGMNNLLDLTFDERYAGICGYTQQEVEHYFGTYIDEVAGKNNYNREETLAEIKSWYNGYSWDGKTFVYNPYSALLLFNYGYFEEHWFTTGSSTGFLKLMRKLGDFSPVFQEQIFVSRDFAKKQALENLDVVPLFFQAGYLTIKAYHADRRKFELQIPNEEVRLALSESVMIDFSGKTNTQVEELGLAKVTTMPYFS